MRKCDVVKEKAEKHMEAELRRRLEDGTQREAVGRAIKMNVEKGGSILTICNIVMRLWMKRMIDMEIEEGGG